MRKRILFVDDEPDLVRVYAMVMGSEKREWEVRSATSGTQALAWMKATPFDVIVTDLHMPGMSGVELLSEARKLHPRTSRIILSGTHDQEQVARCLATTHQFISKPVDLPTLRQTVIRICGLDRILMDENLKALVGQFDALPSFPTLYFEIMRELSAPNVSLDRIAEIVARDPAMTAKILHIANSAALGLALRISSPFEAIQHLGTGVLRSLAISAHVFASFDAKVRGFSMEEFTHHAVLCARLASAISQSRNSDTEAAEDSCVAGMLHDIGRLMLATRMPERFQEAVALSVGNQIPLSLAEERVFGASHAAVGAYLLGLWGLPAPIVEAVAFHHTPDRSDTRAFGPLACVHVADALQRELEEPGSLVPPPGLDESYLNAIGVSDRVEGWRTIAADLFRLFVAPTS